MPVICSPLPIGPSGIDENDPSAPEIPDDTRLLPTPSMTDSVTASTTAATITPTMPPKSAPSPSETSHTHHSRSKSVLTIGVDVEMAIDPVASIESETKNVKLETADQPVPEAVALPSI